jgi:hypothetical protein
LQCAASSGGGNGGGGVVEPGFHQRDGGGDSVAFLAVLDLDGGSGGGDEFDYVCPGLGAGKGAGAAGDADLCDGAGMGWDCGRGGRGCDGVGDAAGGGVDFCCCAGGCGEEVGAGEGSAADLTIGTCVTKSFNFQVSMAFFRDNNYLRSVTKPNCNYTTRCDTRPATRHKGE